MKYFDSGMFHRALRKCLDSQASAICWNAIHLTTAEQWDRFVDQVTEAEGTLAKRCRDLYLWGEYPLNLLMIGLEMLTDGEYAVLEKYSMLDDEEGDLPSGDFYNDSGRGFSL